MQAVQDEPHTEIGSGRPKRARRRSRAKVKPHVAALCEAIRIAGGKQRHLAERLREYLPRSRVSQQLVPEYWDAIERITGGKVTREQLRPDLFRKMRQPRDPAASG